MDVDPLTTILDVGPSNGILTPNVDGSFTYTLKPNFYGTDSFTYHANDGTADSNIAKVTITVNPAVNNPQVADIVEIDDETILLPVIIKVTPLTLNL